MNSNDINGKLNTDSPLISIMVPIYNVEKYLEKCIDSLLSQTYQNIEVILVDDGSTDKSGELCDLYKEKDNRILVYHKKNGGVSDTRNFCIKKATGQYLTFVDPDDYVDYDYVEYLYKILCKYGAQMSICQLRVHLASGKIKEIGKSGDEILVNKNCIERMLYHDVIDTTACMKLYAKELFDDIEYPVGRIFEDHATTYRLMLKCDYIAVGYESKYNYIYRENSIVNCEFNLNKMDLIYVTDKLAEELMTVYPELENAVLRRQVYARISTLNQMIDTKGYDDERKEILEYILANCKKVLEDVKTPKRDKYALEILKHSYKFYRVMWHLYGRFFKHII